MKYFITNFSNIKKLDKACIPISTCNSDPKFYHSDSYDKSRCFVNKDGILLGIREESFLMPSGTWETLPENCENCDHSKSPNCYFLKAYRDHLNNIDFNWLLAEFNRVAEDVRKVTRYNGEPKIVLLVWEAETNPCSERQPLIDLFKCHGIDLINWH